MGNGVGCPPNKQLNSRTGLGKIEISDTKVKMTVDLPVCRYWPCFKNGAWLNLVGSDNHWAKIGDIFYVPISGVHKKLFTSGRKHLYFNLMGTTSAEYGFPLKFRI